MKEGIKITALELENVKRIKAITLSPSANGLTVIGGKNAQGKTSVLDGICYALGGEKYRPTTLQREGGMAEASMTVTLSNGLVAERKGKNAALKVTDPTGKKSGQRVLDEFIGALALNLSSFMGSNDQDKARVLLDSLGIGETLATLDEEEKTAYDKRHAAGVIADQKEKFAKEQPEYHDVPDKPLSASEIMGTVQAISNRNAERNERRARIRQLESSQSNMEMKRDRLKNELAEAEAELLQLNTDLFNATVEPVTENESTAEFEAKIEELESINAKVRANLDKAKAEEDAEEHRRQWGIINAEVEEVRARRLDLLNGSKMPLDGLTIGQSEKGVPILLYNGQAWDGMSSMEQMRVAVSIVRKVNPDCGFVLLDGIETFDVDQLADFAAWLESEGLQAIATRVGEGSECSVIIEDGAVKEDTTKKEEW